MNAPPLPWPHQTVTMMRGLNTPVLFDTSDPGTGKTRAHIEIFAQRKAEGKTTKALVVCPKSLMVAAWKNDIHKFAPHLSVSLAYAERRTAAFDIDADIYIINTDGVKWLAKQKQSFFKRFGESATLIIDESTAFKHHTSDRSKAMRKVAKFFPIRTLMTGTPITSSVTDIWHQMMLLDMGARLGSNFTAFRNASQMPVPNKSGIGVTWEDKPDVHATIAFMIKDISVRHQFDDVMDVPENRTHVIEFDLEPKLVEAYNELAQHAVLELESGNVQALNAAVLVNKLLQLASGSVYGAEGEAHTVSSMRYELVADLVAERQHSVVFFNWGHQKEQLAALLDARKIPYAVLDGSTPIKQRAKLVDEYQDGKYQAILLHPQTGAHGLTLTRGRTTIWASPRYEPDFLKQGIHRVYRGGQTHKTENLLVCARNTLESGVYDRLNGRYNRMVSLLELLKGAACT